MGRVTGALAAALAAVLLCAAPAGAAEWLAGDGHVHTCYSHDAWCIGEPPQEETLYSSGGSVEQRFAEAAAKGLDFIVISDHDSVGALTDPAYGSSGVAGVPAYEASLAGGHAQMLGATRLYPEGSGDALSTQSLADALRADGGLFQANHPSYRDEATFDRCEQADLSAGDANPLFWKYGYSVQPDAIEVWNTTTLIEPAQLYYECWLQRGARIAITGGSDSHGANQASLAVPTTWALAEDRSTASILAAIRAGRTSVSRAPPVAGGARLLIEADADRDGDFESGIGDTVAPGTPMRVRADGLTAPALVRVRSNGRSVVDGERLDPGGAVRFDAPGDPGWAYAVLYMTDATRTGDPGCAPTGQSIDTCSADLAIAGMTSPIWIGAAAEPVLDPAPAGVMPGALGPEPDDQGPVALATRR